MTCDERAERQAAVARIEGELIAAKIRLYCTIDNERSPPDPSALKRQSWWLWWYLLLFVVVGVASTVLVLIYWDKFPIRDFSLAAALGVFGAALSGLMSLNARVAMGWEFDDGSREPDPAEKKERFNARMSKGFFARPILGLATGPLVLAGLKIGQFVDEAMSKQVVDERYRIVFYCVLAGFLSKSVLDWLKDAFKSAIGK